MWQAGITKCGSFYGLQSVAIGITKCVRLGLQSVAEMDYKVWQGLQSVAGLQSELVHSALKIFFIKDIKLCILGFLIKLLSDLTLNL